ncbi:uncharacterized protein [Dermacentor andersoni]|uniref:uncharacterized protein n=1 Tax=Dermacentor andersoni TaxID=34620 RepID=UPI002416C5AD|nr:uncharacterized protein LOC129384663 [Dermacentor andersoni]
MAVRWNMHTLTLALTISLILMINGTSIEDLKEFLLGKKIWVKYRTYPRPLYIGRTCTSYEPTKVVTGQYHIIRRYKSFDTWSKETLKGYLNQRKGKGSSPPILELWSNYGEDDVYKMIYWNHGDRCAVMKRGKDQCEVFQWGKYIDTSRTFCDLECEKRCGYYKDEIYSESCQGASKRKEPWELW